MQYTLIVQSYSFYWRLTRTSKVVCQLNKLKTTFTVCGTPYKYAMKHQMIYGMTFTVIIKTANTAKLSASKPFKLTTLSQITVRVEIFEVYKYSWISWCAPYPRKLIHYK